MAARERHRANDLSDSHGCLRTCILLLPTFGRSLRRIADNGMAPLTLGSLGPRLPNNTSPNHTRIGESDAFQKTSSCPARMPTHSLLTHWPRVGLGHTKRPPSLEFL